MMGQHSRSEALFYYFRLEDQVPENHLLRLIEKHISFAFVREKLKDSNSETGRPSIDPELPAQGAMHHAPVQVSRHPYP
jgi:transposase